MTNAKVFVVQKARYGVLFLPILWLFSSLWVVINRTSADFYYIGIQEVDIPPSIWESGKEIYLIILTVWAFVKIVLAIKQRTAISAELMSGFAFVLGLTITMVKDFFHFGDFLFYVGMGLTDFAAIIVIVTLFQGKPFLYSTLYHKDVQIRRV